MEEVPEYPTLLRSEVMSLVQMYLPLASAHACVQRLAALECVQFLDLNKDMAVFSRPQTHPIRLCAEIERLLRFLTAQVVGAGHEIAECTAAGIASGLPVLDELHERLEREHSRLSTLLEGHKHIATQRTKVATTRGVVEFVDGVLNDHGVAEEHSRISEEYEDEERGRLLRDPSMDMERGRRGPSDLGVELEFVAGSIPSTRMAALERTLWRLLRGNLVLRYSDIQSSEEIEPTNPSSGSSPRRTTAFIVFAHGASLLEKARVLTTSMGGVVQSVSSTSAGRTSQMEIIVEKQRDLSTVAFRTEVHLSEALARLAPQLGRWWLIVQREKRTFETLNRCLYESAQGQTRQAIVAEGWVPSRKVAAVKAALRGGQGSIGEREPAGVIHELGRGTGTGRKPPTYHATNPLTSEFQGLIDSYGVARYGEVNPGLFAVVTFPFLFSAMFSDVGHGAVLAMFGVGALMVRDKKGKPMQGAWMMLMMGIFAMYSGFVYNDIFSLALNIWPSQWSWPTGFDIGEKVEAIKNEGVIYPFGLDPRWKGADNALVFTNSLKMKGSIIIGVSHMFMAICLQVINHRHFGQQWLIWAEFLPQILFFSSIFVYLAICIVYKWTVDWEATGRNPPSLLTMLITFFLSPGKIKAGEELYPHQATVQRMLLYLALVCVPWMLCTKPYILWREMQAKDKVAQGYQGVQLEEREQQFVNEDESDQDGEGHETRVQEVAPRIEQSGTEDEEDHGLSDIIIHQVIHMIEFCLSCISNTASYLRLWALSLAHAQLSEVMWSMTLEDSFEGEGVAGSLSLAFAWANWFQLTVSGLVIIEGMSAFLHALRLHWVESMDKHYSGSGYPFEPLTFDGTDDVPKDGEARLLG